MRKIKRFATLDIGSNTVRLLVAEPEGSGFAQLHSSQIITRLGQRMHEAGSLSEAAMERTVSGAGSLVESASHLKPFEIAATATHAVRTAKNRERFRELFRRRLGFDLDVIEWEREAELSLRGAFMVIKKRGPLVLFDIGGGSTEFVYRSGKGGIRRVGTDLGVVRIAETYIQNAPLTADEYRRMSAYLKSEIAAVADKLKFERPFTLVGTAGSITSIAAIHFDVTPYDPEKINNRIIKTRDVETILDKIGGMTIKQRGKIPGLENGREDLIIPGIGIVLAVMELFGTASLTISDPGLREGAMLALMDGTLEGKAI
ncbi:MAG: exopolyphosphatase [bacterium]|nr:MAG: exopolyphosphatase [bacterium]